MANAKRDENRIPTLLAVTDDGNLTPTTLKVDPATKRLKVSAIISSGALTSLNGLTVGSQDFAVGTAGTDINISSATISATAGRHTFNFPNASSTKRGVLTSSDWSTFNSKLGTANILGTTNQIIASVSGSDVILSTPQDLHTVANFGVGTLRANNLPGNRILSSSGSSIVALPAMTNGQLIIGNTGNAPSLNTLTAGTNITITNSPGSITISSSVSGSGTLGASYIVVGLDPDLTNERRLQGTPNQVILTDGGANGDLILSTPQNIDANANFGAGTLRANNLVDGRVLLATGSTIYSPLNPNVGFGTVRVENLPTNRVLSTSGSTIIALSAMTNGQLIIGNTGNAPSVANLTAGTNIVITNAAGAITISSTAGGAGANEFTYVMRPRDFVLPNSAFPALNKTSGTNTVYETLDFDQATKETCYAQVPIPPSATPTTMKIRIFWTASTGSGTVIWEVVRRSIADGEVLDSNTTPATITNTVADSLLSTGAVHVAPITLTTGTDSVADDLLDIRFSRDAANASDTLNADAKLLSVLFEITD